MINILPTFVSVIQAVTTLCWGFLSDYTGSRFWFFFGELWLPRSPSDHGNLAHAAGPLVYGLFPNAVLTAWPDSLKLKQAAFTTLGVQLVTAVIYSWWAEICSADPLERGGWT